MANSCNSSHYEKFADGTVVCIDDEIPFEIPATWAWSRLSNLVQINPKNYVEDDTDAAFIPMEKIDATYLSNFTYSVRKWKEIKSGFTHFADGDVAFAKITPCFQNRKSMILKALPNGIGAGTTELKVLRTYGETLSKEYLLFFLESPYFIEEAKFKGTANQQRIISGYLEEKLFPIPPMEEQKRVVEKILNSFAIVEKYSKAQEMLDNLNKNISPLLRKSILQEAIQGHLVPQDPNDEPASVLIQRIKEEKQKLVKEGKLKKKDVVDSIIFKGDDNRYYEQIGKNVTDITDEIPFDIPDSWEWIRGKTAFHQMESTKPKGENFLYIDVDAVNNVQNVIDKAKTIATSKAPSRATRKLHTGDVLFSMVRPYLRNIALVKEEYAEAIASTGFYVIRPTCALFSPYLFYLMLSSYVVDGLNQYMKGDNSPSINNGHIENYLYPLPPINEQRRIVSMIEKILDRIKG